MGGTDNDIIVMGWSDRYAAAARTVLKLEGGHVNDPLDRGGETKFGVSLRFLVVEGKIDLDGDGRADFDLDMDGDIDGVDIRRLTRGDAKFLFHRCFWLPIDADIWPRPIGEMMFDQGVNAGLLAAKKLLQRSINACLRQMRVDELLDDDGVLGPVTRAAFDRVLAYPAIGMPALIIAYRLATADRYRAIVQADPRQKRFLDGWLTRANRLGRE